MRSNIGAIRGRSEGEWFNSLHFQVLELSELKIANPLTSVPKDNMLLIVYERA